MTVAQAMQLFVYGVLVLIPWGLNATAAKADLKGYADAVGMAGLLVGVWILTNTIGLVVSPPASKMLHPVIDLVSMAVVVGSLGQAWRWWKFALASLFLAQIMTHAVFWAAWVPQHLSLSERVGQDVYWRYMATVNILWLGQLFVTAWPGGRHVVDRFNFGWVRDRGRPSPDPSG